MDKTSIEVATQITVAWLSALGSAKNHKGYESIEILTDPAKIIEFFKAIEQAVREI